MPIRCSFCLKTQLISNRSSPYNLIQISPVISVHNLCLQASNGLQSLSKAEKNKVVDYSNDEILAEILRCKTNTCGYCHKPGASVMCSRSDCYNWYHLPCCHALSSSSRRSRKSPSKTFCQDHSSKRNERPSIPSKLKRDVIKKSSSLLRNETEIQVINQHLPCCITPCRFGDNLNGYNLPLKTCPECKLSTAHSLCAISPQQWVCSKCKNSSKTAKKLSTTASLPKSPPPTSTKGKSANDAKFANSLCSSMKLSFCKDVDLQLGKSRGRKRHDRSPLGPKQSSLRPCTKLRTKQNDILGKENVQNTRNVSRKKSADHWVVNSKRLNGKICSSGSHNCSDQRLGKKERKKRTNLKPFPKKRKDQQHLESKSKTPTGSGNKKKSPLSSLDSSPAKKFVDNSPNPASFARDLTKALTKVSNARKSGNKEASTVQKINVEPISLENRQIYHAKNSLPVEHGESEAQEDYQWLVDGSNRLIDDFVDLNDGEKAFFKLWNTHLHKYPCFGDAMMVRILHLFVEENAKSLLRENLYKNFLLHLSNFYDFGIINQETFLDLVLFVKFKFSQLSPLDEICDDSKPATARNPYLSLISKSSQYLVHYNSVEDDSFKENDVGPSSSPPEGSLKLYLSDSDCDENDTHKQKKADSPTKSDIVLYANDKSIESISDLPVIDSGLCCKGTRFKSFASTVFYGCRKDNIRRKRETNDLLQHQGRSRKTRRMTESSDVGLGLLSSSQGLVKMRRRQCAV